MVYSHVSGHYKAVIFFVVLGVRKLFTLDSQQQHGNLTDKQNSFSRPEISLLAYIEHLTSNIGP